MVIRIIDRAHNDVFRRLGEPAIFRSGSGESFSLTVIREESVDNEDLLGDIDVIFGDMVVSVKSKDLRDNGIDEPSTADILELGGVELRFIKPIKSDRFVVRFLVR